MSTAALEPYQDVLMPDPPAAGENYTYTVPGDERIVIVSAMCELTTALGGADRGVSLQVFAWTGRRMLVAGTWATVSPGTTQAFSWQSAAAAGAWAVDDAALAGMPRVTLLPMCTATITVTGLAAGDQLSEIALVLEHYPPRDLELAPAAFPLWGELADMGALDIAADVRALRETMGELSGVLGLHTEALKADRRQRILSGRT